VSWLGVAEEGLPRLLRLFICTVLVVGLLGCSFGRLRHSTATRRSARVVRS
jgi:hypothetical protein